MPGSGKSTIGKSLSEMLNIAFFDSDDIIEKKENKKINTIFNDFGENYFRKLEINVLNDVLKESHFILSTGGGMPCFNDIMKLLKENTVSFYIYSDIELLLKRLSNSVETTNRPLINSYKEKELRIYLENTLQRRKSFYEAADFTVHSEEAIEQILLLI
jgi:shikimate kinase